MDLEYPSFILASDEMSVKTVVALVETDPAVCGNEAVDDEVDVDKLDVEIKVELAAVAVIVVKLATVVLETCIYASKAIMKGDVISLLIDKCQVKLIVERIALGALG